MKRSSNEPQPILLPSLRRAVYSPSRLVAASALTEPVTLVPLPRARWCCFCSSSVDRADIFCGWCGHRL